MSGAYAYIRSRNGALAALLIAVVLVIAMGFVAVSALFRAAEGDTQSFLDRLAVYRAEVAQRPVIEQRLREALGRAANSPGLLKASTGSLAQAELEGIVKATALDNAAEIHSTELLPVMETGDFQTIAIQYDLSAPMSRLRDLTYAIESRTPYLFIDHVSIVAQQNWQPADTGPHDPQLEVRWTIRGYRWAGKR
jgi:hypothetical protein